LRAGGTKGSADRFRPRLASVAANLIGAIVVLAFARATVRSYQSTHQLIGAVFIVQQVLVAGAFLVRRSPSSLSRRPLDWATAMGGSLGGFLMRPSHLQPASVLGVILQICGLTMWTVSFFSLGRSFGLVAADRGVVARGAYRVVRHPLYAAYMVTQLGYLLQSASAWNAAVLCLTWSCQIARSLAEERLLSEIPAYAEYRSRVRWRLMPLVW
jgi:protein-S-isoprenylcysteine O-methyltransferase Ste14